MSRNASVMSCEDNPKTPSEIARFFWRLPSGRLLGVLTATTIGTRVAVGDFGPSDLAVALAVLAAWPFVEWMIHRIVLHMRPVEWPARRWGPVALPRFRFDPAVARIHRAHHRNPWKLSDVMIPIYTYGYTLPVTLLFWFGLFNVPQALTGVAMTVLLGLHYEVVHLMAHCRYRPKSRYYYRLWRNHRLHHCKSEKHWLGVTMLLADDILSTGGDPKDVQTSPTCRNLEGQRLGA